MSNSNLGGFVQVPQAVTPSKMVMAEGKYPKGAASGVASPAYITDDVIVNAFTRQFGILMPTTSNTAMHAMGVMNGLTHTDATSHSEIDSTGRAFTQATSTSTNNICSTASGRVFNYGEDLIFSRTFVIETSVSDIRLFMGLTNSTSPAATIGADDPAAAAIALQFSTNRGDTNFMAMVDDGTTQTTSDMGIAPVQNKFYHLVIDANGTAGEIRFLIYDNLGAEIADTTISSDLPATDTDLCFMSGIQTLSASSVDMLTYGSSVVSRKFGLPYLP